jgi:hypothetical protein
MASGLPPFKYESSVSLTEEHPEQPWRRNMEICGDAFLFQFMGLNRSSSCNNGKRRSVIKDHVYLLPV